MRQTKFYLLIFICSLSLAEDQLPPCTKTFKFRKTDSTCGSFEEACVRQDDDCNEFKKFCEKCPSSNFTAAHLIEILKKNKNILSELNLIRNDLKKNVESEKITSLFNQSGECNATRQSVLSSIIIILLVLIIILLLVEIRFKIITKKFELLTGKGEKKNYRIIKSKRYLEQKDHEEAVKRNEEIGNILDFILQKRLKEYLDDKDKAYVPKIESMTNNLSRNSFYEGSTAELAYEHGATITPETPCDDDKERL